MLKSLHSDQNNLSTILFGATESELSSDNFPNAELERSDNFEE